MRMFRRRNPQWLRDEIRAVGLTILVTIACCWLVAWYFWSLLGPLE